MVKSELIEKLAQQLPHLQFKDVELATNVLIDQMEQSIAKGERIEIRGFGSFSLRQYSPRIGRNPKTGERVSLGLRYAPHFKPGQALRDRVNAARNSFKIVD